MQKILALLLILTFTAQAASVRARLIQAPTGTPVILYLKDGSEVKGKILAAEDQSVRLQIDSHDVVEEKSFDYKQIRAAHLPGPRMSPGRAVLSTLGGIMIFSMIAGVIIGG